MVSNTGTGNLQPENELYKKISGLLDEWQELATELKNKEKHLHDEVMKAVDQEQIQKILQKIQK